jgi:hypothetical protein
MACEHLDTCALLDELSSSTPVGFSMLMSTICENNKFACEGYGLSKKTGAFDAQDYQQYKNKMEAMEAIMDSCNGISITG